MDVKAMAKSKRSHTRHHQPRKHIHASKTPPPSSSSASADSADPKAAKNEARERKTAVRPPSLPSNWDRYDEHGDADGDAQSVGELPIDKAALDVVKPMSKGANFGELIAQAKESRVKYSPSFHDSLPDFYQGLGPMLSARGESILSWDGGDDFLADDVPNSNQEAPFLRLDLQDLAEHLANVDVAERLFIEDDLLPPELRGQGTKVSDNQMFPLKSEKQRRIRVPETFDELLSLYLEDEQNAEQEKDTDNNGTTSLAAGMSIGSSPKTAPAPYVTDKKPDNIPVLDSRETSLATHVTKEDSKPSSGFRAGAAEAELDVLLNSFSKTKLVDSSKTQSEVATSTKQLESPTPLLAGSSSRDIPVTSSRNDALDDLLGETSKQDTKGSLSQSTTEIRITSFDLPSSSSSSSHPSSKSKALQDFDSWFDTI